MFGVEKRNGATYAGNCRVLSDSERNALWKLVDRNPKIYWVEGIAKEFSTLQKVYDFCRTCGVNGSLEVLHDMGNWGTVGDLLKKEEFKNKKRKKK